MRVLCPQVLGRYNWTLGARVARAFGHPTPYALQGEVTKVLMLSPDVDLARTRNWTEFAHVIAGLFQVKTHALLHALVCMHLA